METPNNYAVVTPTPAGEWKGRVQVAGSDLALPSTNVARVRPISPAAFLQSGIMPDPLRPIMQKAINDKKGLPPKVQKKMMDDPVLLASAMEMMDRTICYVVVSPEIQMPPACIECGEYAKTKQHDSEQPTFKHAYQEGSREQGVLYADELDMTDKEFIFQWVLGGTRDLERFRKESSESVGVTSNL